MKKGLVVFSLMLAVLLLASCRSLSSSVSAGIGYGGGTTIYNETEAKMAVSGISATETALFDFNSQDTGFRLFQSLYLAFDKKTIKEGLSVGPSWEFGVSDNFRILVGVGPTFGFTFHNPSDYDMDALVNYSFGAEAVVEARYFVSERVFVGLKGEFGYNFVDNLHYIRYSPYLGNHEGTIEGHGTNFDASFIIGRNF